MSRRKVPTVVVPDGVINLAEYREGRKPNLPSELPEPDDEYIWQCRCGSTSFHYYEDGFLECVECETRTVEYKNPDRWKK